MKPQHLDDLSLLPSIRVAKGISLEQISDVTKISVSSLRAIETGHFEQLPGGIYNVNYIRQYAREVGVEETELLNQYHAKMDAHANTAPSTTETGPPDRLRKFCSRLAEVVLSGGRKQNNKVIREPRFPADQPAQVIVIGAAATSLLPGTVLDISRSGVGIRVPALIALGSALRVEVGNLVAHCEVRNCKPNAQGSFDVGLKVDRVLSKSDPA
jgi:transcriptional regulator with XRE-family HTH domain